jgi:hypothetical protein
MTSKDIESELDRDPFIPLALHLASGKVVKVSAPGVAWLLQNAVLVFRNARPGKARVGGYDVIDLRNIERIEQVRGRNGAKR